MSGPLTSVKVALDWTPNTIHSGLYMALEKGLYKDAGLDVQLLPPDDDYTLTPARRLLNGDVDLAICPSESCIAYNSSKRMKLQAIYAILQKDASAIASTRLRGLKDLAHGTYGSYNAKYEDAIVRAMVGTAGGEGASMQIQGSTGKLSLFEQVRQGSIDATWVFLPWEGVEAELEDGTAVHAFRAEDYGVPYGYSPVIARNAGGGGGTAALSTETLRGLVAATAAGYEGAMREAREAAAILAPHCRPQRSARFLELSQGRINHFYGDGDGRLGSMRVEKWEAWIAWLVGQGLLGEREVEVGDLFTIECFEGA